MDFLVLLVSSVVVILTFVYFHTKRKYSYWSSRNINGPSPVPFLGNIWEQMKRGQMVTEVEWANKYGRIYGTYIGSLPALAITDPELIKLVMVKDFQYFINRRKAISTEEHTTKSLFNLENDDWKRVRQICSPAFTTSKLRGMKPLMLESLNKLSSYFESISSEGSGEINVKEVFSGFTIDVIASTSFATNTDANGDRSKKNPFIEHGLNLFKVNLLGMMRILLLPMFIRRYLSKIRPQENFAFFRQLAKQVVKQRREGNVKRNDFVQLLMDAYVDESELKKTSYETLTASNEKEDPTVEKEESKQLGKTKNFLDDDEIIANIILFFLAGFETTSSALVHTLFHLAQDQEIQNRLLSEIEEALHGLDITSGEYYDTVMTKISYLDACIKETLRLYPPLVRLERRVNTDGYNLGGVELENDQLVTISAFAIHRNPKYYPEPLTYNPERFMPENKHLLTPYTYLPFGVGSRNCIGMRFAYQEIKLCLARVITQFRFDKSPQTPEKLEFSKMGIVSVKPFTLSVSKR